VTELTPEQFFWPDPDEPNEQWVIGVSPWLHENISDYISVQPSSISRANVQLVDRVTGESQLIHYHYWAGPRNYTSIVDWEQPGKPRHKELIHVHDLPCFENGSQVIRIDLSSDYPTATLNSIMHGRNGDEFSIDLLNSDNDP